MQSLMSQFGRLGVSPRCTGQATRLTGCTGVAPSLSARKNGICSYTRVASLQQVAAVREQCCVAVCSKHKLKTCKAAAKRFKVTGTGKLKRRRPGKQHINEKKSSKRLRSLGREVIVNTRVVDNLIGCMPYAGITQR